MVAVIVIVLVAGLALFGLNPFGLGNRAPGLPVDIGVTLPATETPGRHSPAAPPIPGHEVYGFVPYWEMDAGIADHVADTDLSTLALFSVTHRSSGRMHDTQTGYRRITGKIGQQLIDEARDRGTRLLRYIGHIAVNGQVEGPKGRTKPDSKASPLPTPTPGWRRPSTARLPPICAG